MSEVELNRPSSAGSGGSRVDIPLTEEEEARIREIRTQGKSGGRVESTRPRPLGWFSVFCVIANRMIGSGIFRTPDVVMKETESVSAAMIFWTVGALIAISGTLVFVEFGLTIPQILIGTSSVAVPRNGGEKNYLEYVYHRPRFLATCLYGIPFIFLGNMASNAVLFGQSIYIALSGETPSNAGVRGIAIAIATLACFLHIYSRQLGIYLNNGFGLIKAILLLVLIIVGIISFAGGLPTKTIADAEDNYGQHSDFVSSPSGSYGYASSFLAIIFAYGGFNQANYILGNIKRPRRRFKATALITVLIVSVLYICLNLCYYGVVPYKQLVDPNTSIADWYFARTLSRTQSRRIVAAFIAFSSLGNIIIQTFTASRVKQELAKESILPRSQFFAKNQAWHWRFWQHHNERGDTSEATPVGALLLHWVFCIILILSTFALSPLAAYGVYVNIYSFTIDALFGFCVGAGLLGLRIADMFKDQNRWADISSENKWVSIVSSLIFSLANFYPLVAIWFRPPKGQVIVNDNNVAFWVAGTVGFVTVALGLIYWVVFRYVVPWLREEDLQVDRINVLGKDGDEVVVVNEIVAIGWMTRHT